MDIQLAAHTKTLAEHPNWGKFLGNVVMVTQHAQHTVYHTTGLSFAVHRDQVEPTMTKAPQVTPTPQDYKRVLDVLKVGFRLGKVTQPQVTAAATAYRDAVYRVCDDTGKARPRMSIKMLAQVR